MADNLGIDPRTWMSAVDMANSALSGTMSAVNGQRQKRLLDSQRAKNQTMFNRDYYERNLDRSESQEALREANDAARDQMKVNRARAAVNGYTPESSLALQNAVNKTQAGVVSGIAQKGAERKSTLARDFFARDDKFSQKQQDLYRQHGEAWEQQAHNAENSMQRPTEAIAAKASGKSWRSKYQEYMTEEEYQKRLKQDEINSTQENPTVETTAVVSGSDNQNTETN